MTPEAEVTALLARKGPGGDFVYAERDVVACFAMLARANPASCGPAARRYIDRLAIYANVRPDDPVPVRVDKLTAYFAAHPIPAALVRAIEAALGGGARFESARDFGRLLGHGLAKTCTSGPRAGALHFLIADKIRRDPS